MTPKDTNIFNDFNVSPFKKELPPKNDSETTKKELKYLSTIDLDKKFFQKKDDIIGNFFDFLDSEKVKYDKKLLRKVALDAVKIILELKNFFKRPRPFKLDKTFKALPQDVIDGILLARATGDSSGLIGKDFIMRRSSWSANPGVAGEQTIKYCTRIWQSHH